MDPRAELQELLAGLLDGPAAENDAARLRSLLAGHPELHEEYLGHLRLHALLCWRAVPVAAPRVRRRWPAWGAIAAALAIAAGAFLLAIRPASRPLPDVVAHMAEWNLNLADVSHPGERRELYESQVGTMTALLAKAPLPAPDRALAEALLENGSWLASNDDPLGAAGRFGEIADRLVTRIDAAVAQDDPARAASLTDAYCRVAEAGVAANLERGRARSRDPHRKKKLARVSASRARRNKRMDELLARSPEPSRKAIHRAMHGHRHKKKHHRKHGK